MAESNHYRRTMQVLAKIDKALEEAGLVKGVDFRDISKLEAEVLKPNLAHHYICELAKQLEDGREVYIDIHHLRNVGITKIFPTIVRVIETSPDEKQVEQIDIYSIDDKGNCLVHTNKSYPDGREVETRDTSLERLLPYKDVILGARRLSIWARFRLEKAFQNYEQRSK